MSDAKKCDRCGSFYDPYSPEITIRKVSAITAKLIDLCPVCQDSIKSWLYLKPKEADNE